MFVDLCTKTLPVPTDHTATVTIRKLSWMELEEAQAVARDKYMRLVGGFAGMREVVEMQRRDRSTGTASAAPAEPTADQKADAEFEAHDVRTLLQYGIKGWTYPRPISADAIALIDEDCARFFAREIFNLTKARTEAERKNG